MKTQTIPISELTSTLESEWRALQLSNPALHGPCFHPLLFKTIGAHFERIETLVIEGERKGFLPYHLGEGPRIAEPVPMCDYQMVLAEPGSSWNISEILNSGRLIAWDFDHLMLETIGVDPSAVYSATHSRQIDVRAGYDHYIASMTAAGKSQRNLKEKRKKLERDYGPVRFVPFLPDVEDLNHIFRWKTSRFGEVGEAARQTLRDLHSTAKDGLRGILSGLYAGDTLVAIHFGLAADGILFYWFPSFNPDMRRYTPGALLVQELISHLPQFQAQTLDLGPGGEGYKDYFSNHTVSLISGTYELPSPFTYLRKCKRNALKVIRGDPAMHSVARKTATILRNLKKSS